MRDKFETLFAGVLPLENESGNKMAVMREKFVEISTDGRTDTNDSEKTLNSFHVNCNFVLYHFFFTFHILQLLSLYNNYNFIRLCFCIILFV